MMPKPWVGGGWVRADQGSQGRKEHAPETPYYSSPTTRTEKWEARTHLEKTMSFSRVGDPLHPPPLLGLECRFPGMQQFPSCSSQRPDKHRGSRTDTGDPGHKDGPQLLLRRFILGAPSCG